MSWHRTFNCYKGKSLQNDLETDLESDCYKIQIAKQSDLESNQTKNITIPLHCFRKPLLHKTQKPITKSASPDTYLFKMQTKHINQIPTNTQII